jgi:hypothetical protein
MIKSSCLLLIFEYYHLNQLASFGCHEKVYRSYREYYNITLREAIKIIKKCVNLTGSKIMSEDKFYRKYKIKRSSKLNGFQYGLNSENCQLDQTNKNNQIGGTYSESYQNENFDYNLRKSSQTVKSYTYYTGVYEQFNKLMQIIIN